MKNLLTVAAMLLLTATEAVSMTTVTVPANGNIATVVNANSVGTPGSCSPASGWRGAITAGLCVHVANGTVSGGTITNTGTASAPIVIIADNLNVPLVSSALVIQNTSGANRAYIYIEGLHWNNPSQANAITLGPGHHRWVEYNFIENMNTNQGCNDPRGGVIQETFAPMDHDTINGNIIRHFGAACSVNGYHGIYADGAALTLTNNIISGGGQGWGIQKQYASNTDTTPGTISNNTVFNNAGGIVINEENGMKFSNWTVANNVIVNNGCAGCGTGGQFGIDYYNLSGTGNNVVNNTIYGNLPANFANHGAACTPGVASCPGSNNKSDANTGVTFINFQTDSASSPAASYNSTNYKLKSPSTAIGGGVSTCAASGINPCIPSNDFYRVARPASGVQDNGFAVFTAAGVPIVSISPSPLNFGTVAVSSSSGVLTSTLTNTGSTSLTITAKTISGTNASSFSFTDNCAGTITAGNSCVFSVTATPQSAGNLSANVTITDNASGSPHQIPLLVTGGSITQTLNPTSMSFGVVAPASCSAVQLTTMTNTGTSNMTVGAATITGANAADYLFGGTGSCFSGQVLTSGQACTISMKFCPSATGSRVASLGAVSNASNSPTAVPLTGTGGAPVVSLTPASAACGAHQVGTSSTCQTFTLANTGNLTLSGIAVSLTGTNVSSYSQSNNCPATLAPSASCTITGFFNPVANGALTANISVASSATSSPNTVTMTGTGTIPTTITLSPQTINFGNVRQGTTTNTTGITITNTGSSTATISSIVANAPFSQANSCPASLTAGASCIINVSATPSTTGTVNDTLTVTDSAAGSPHNASLSVTGVKSIASLSPTSLGFGNQPVGNVSAPKTIVLTNTGTATLSSLGGIVPNVDEIVANYPPTGWKPVCILPSCNPGGAGVPTATSQTFNNASPSKDGKSMFVSLSGPSNTNALWVYIAGALDSTTNITSDFWVQPGTTAAAQYEFDQFNFSSSTGIEYMWGTQCNKVTNKWQVFDQLNLVWVNVPGSACSLAAGSFHHIVEIVHRIPGDTSCSGQPCLYYDSITVDGVAVPGLPMTEPAGPLPVGWASAVGWQVQLNIGSGGSPVSENVDLLNFNFSGIQFTGTNPTDFSQSNTCTSDLAPSATCGIALTFTPGGVGARTANLSIASNDPASPTVAALTGTGIATAPAVCLSTPSINFGNQPVNTTSGSLPVVVTNCGTANLVISAVNAAGNFASTGCVATVAPNATCTINGTFSPLAAGSLTGTYSIVSNSASSPDVISLSGFGTQTGATLTPNTVNFGSVTVGQPSTNHILTLANTGNTTLAVQSTALTGSNAADFVSGNCPSTLAPNATCTYPATFNPSGAGSRTATLTQPFGNGVTSVTVALSGTGVAAAPAVTLTPTSINFGNVTTSVTSAIRTAQIQNSGNAVLNITSITLTGANAADYALTSHCAATLAAGAICTVDLTVTPSGTGARAANLHLIDDAADTPQDVTLTANGVAAPSPAVSLSPSSLSFSPPSIQTTTTSAAQNITATNTGNAALTVSSVTLTGANPGDFTISNNCATVAAGASCAATVNCAPTAAGSRTATVSFTDNASGSPHTAAVSCTGFVGTPILVLAVSNINFGNQTVGTISSPAVFTITNTGLATATSVVISSVGDFSVTDNCGGSITAGSSCSATVTFSPLVLCGQLDPNNPTVCLSNVHLGSISVVSNTSNSPQGVSLQGTAIPVPPPPGPIIMTSGGRFNMAGRAKMGAQ